MLNHFTNGPCIFILTHTIFDITIIHSNKEIRKLLKKELKAVIKRGQDAIEEAINSVGQPVNNQTLQIVLDHFKITNANNLYSAVGNNKIDISVIPSLFLNKTKNKWMRIWKLQFGSSDNKKEDTPTQPTQHNPKKTLHITDADVGSGYKIADCCQPIPGDNVLGFIETGGDVIVHKCDCPVAQKLQASYGNRILSAKWETQKVLSFLTTIEISGVDQTGLLKQIVQESRKHICSMMIENFLCLSCCTNLKDIE